MQIRMKEDMTRDEALMLLEVANTEVATLRQQLTEHEETIEQLEETNAALRDENRQMKLEMEAIGAGGVSSQRITDAPAMVELRHAHWIIQNALNIMTPEQKSEWARCNERDGCAGGGTTRANEREAVLEGAA